MIWPMATNVTIVWQSRALFFTHEVSSELHRAFAVIGGLAAIFVYFAFVLAAVFLSTVLVLFSVGLVLVWTCERMMANNETIPEYIASMINDPKDIKTQQTQCRKSRRKHLIHTSIGNKFATKS